MSYRSVRVTGLSRQDVASFKHNDLDTARYKLIRDRDTCNAGTDNTDIGFNVFC